MAHIPVAVRRQQLLDAAVAVVAREGADGATTRRIAEEAGAPLATLHYCFQTKENLLWATFEKLADTVRLDVDRVAAPSESTTAIATHLVEQAVRWGIENPVANRAQIEITLWAERNDPAFATRVYDLFVESWKGILATAKAPLPDDELETLVRVIIALLDGLAMQLIAHGDESKVLREAETARLMLAAYLGRRSRLRPSRPTTSRG